MKLKKVINLFGAPGCGKDFTQAVIMRWKAEVELGIDSCLSSPAYMYLNENGLIDENGAIKEAA